MKWVVQQEQVSLKEFLETSLPEISSKRAIKKLLDQGMCSVNKKVERFGKVILKKGDVVTLAALEAKKETQDFDPTRILFEDDYFVIYDKPCGIISDGDAFMVECQKYCSTLTPIHRLDKETSGILMFSKTQDILEEMIELFQNKDVQKKYVAIVAGIVEKPKGKIDEPIDVVYREGTTRRFGVKKGGKTAITNYETISTDGEKSLVHLYPITGRTHQLRVHMSFLGHPILGDQAYGREWGDRLFLHAEEVSFMHPITEQRLTVQSPLPPEFEM